MQHEIVTVASAKNHYGYSVLLNLMCTCGEKWNVRKSTYSPETAMRSHVRKYATAKATDRAAVATFSRFANEVGN